LQKVAALQTFLCSELECRVRLHKKYRRAVKAVDGTCAALGTSSFISNTVGASLLVFGIGFVAGITLEAVTGVAGLLAIAGASVSRRSSATVGKHEVVRVLATPKLNTVHIHISRALEDCQVSDDEYKLILEEVEKYHKMKEDIRRKQAPAAAAWLMRILKTS